MSLEVVFDHFVGTAIERPKVTIGGHQDDVYIRRWIAHSPLVQELAVGIEHLNAVVIAVVDEDSFAREVDAEPMHAIEISRTRLVRRSALSAPVHDELAVLVNFATRVFTYPSATNMVLSGSQARYVGL